MGGVYAVWSHAPESWYNNIHDIDRYDCSPCHTAKDYYLSFVFFELSHPVPCSYLGSQCFWCAKASNTFLWLSILRWVPGRDRVKPTSPCPTDAIAYTIVANIISDPVSDAVPNFISDLVVANLIPYPIANGFANETCGYTKRLWKWHRLLLWKWPSIWWRWWLLKNLTKRSTGSDKYNFHESKVRSEFVVLD